MPRLSHPLLFAVPLALGFALACGGSSTTTPPPPPTPTGVTTPAVPAAKTFDQAAFVCCNHERASDLLKEYLDVEKKLFSGDGSHVNGQYTALRGVAKGGIQFGGFASDENSMLQRIADESEHSISLDLAGKRSHFKALSTDVIGFLRKHGGTGSTRVAEARCPMFEGGASWLQTEMTIANPYYGSAMATCGSFQ